MKTSAAKARRRSRWWDHEAGREAESLFVEIEREADVLDVEDCAAELYDRRLGSLSCFKRKECELFYFLCMAMRYMQCTRISH